MKKITRYIIVVLFIMNLAFIWGNSMLDSSSSGGLSDIITGIFVRIFGQYSLGTGGGSQGAWNLVSFYVRKGAHFIEFTSLGILSSMLLINKKEYIRGRIPPLLLCGMSAALIDETIQLFAVNRTSRVNDVWIDFCGFVIGCAIIILFKKLSRKSK